MLPDAEGPCPQLALMGNKELLYSQWLGREMEAGLSDLAGKGMMGKKNHQDREADRLELKAHQHVRIWE